MVKNLRLIVLGVAPLVFGIILNSLIISDPGWTGISMPISFILLVLFGYGAYLASENSRSAVLQAGLICLPGLVMLGLAFYQELIIKEYWVNAAGFFSQVFFLPWVPAVSYIRGYFTDTVNVLPVYTVIWITMLISASLGCELKKRKITASRKDM